MQGRKSSLQRSTRGDKIFDVFNVALMAAVAVVIFYPLYFVVIASFTTPRVVNRGDFLLYPVEFFAGGYKKTFTYPPLWRGYLNSFIYTGLGTAISLVTTLSAATPFPAPTWADGERSCCSFPSPCFSAAA